jgi:hypothetical protein
MMTTQTTYTLQHPATIHACCPSCQHHGQFMLLGVQTWPQVVATKMGMPETIGTYQCEHCETTISEVDLSR